MDLKINIILCQLIKTGLAGKDFFEFVRVYVPVPVILERTKPEGDLAMPFQCLEQPYTETILVRAAVIDGFVGNRIMGFLVQWNTIIIEL